MRLEGMHLHLEVVLMVHMYVEHEPTFWKSVTSVFIHPKEVDGVSQKTAGIIPRVFKSRFYGDVLFYDFAGQDAYYSSHAAVIKSVVDTCPPIFILVIGLYRDETTITHSVSYWLGIIVNQCANMEGKAPLIIVGSHANLIEVAEAYRKKQIILQAVEKFPTFDLVNITSMDCRYSNSSGIKTLRREIEKSCNQLRSRLSVSLNSHMFLIYLVERYSSELAFTLGSFQMELKANIIQNESLKHERILPLIPTTILRLVEICIQLSDKGHILDFHNQTSPEDSFIITDKTALLAEINGTMFAPEDFEQHCQLSTSTGVVPRSKIAEHFKKFCITMLVRFLSHLELAVPIEDEEVLRLIKEHFDKLGLPGDEQYLFCPALIRLEVPPRVFVYQAELSYHFGWILSSIHTQHFLDARFLHVLLLRLALSLGLAPVVDPKIPTLQNQCAVWKTGVSWSTPHGAKILVEVIDRKKVALLIQACHVSCDLLKLRSTIIGKVREAASELCPFVITEELLISPLSMTYPLNISPLTPLFSIKTVAESIVQQHPFTVSVDGTSSLAMCQYEVYAYLGERLLQILFNSLDGIIVSDQYLSALSSCLSKNLQMLDIVQSTIKDNVQRKSDKQDCDLEQLLRRWRDNSKGTYFSLRQILDTLSVMAGRNPLELAGVPPKDVSESSLPDQPLTNTGSDQTVEVSPPAHKPTADGIADVSPKKSLPAQPPTNTGSSLNVENPSLVHETNFTSHPSLGDLVLVDLMKEYRINDAQLDTKIREEWTFDISECFDCVETYLDKLGLTPGQQTQVEELAQMRDVQTAMSRALKLWRRPNPLTATFRALLEILLSLKRGDVAVRVCTYISENISKHK